VKPNTANPFSVKGTKKNQQENNCFFRNDPLPGEKQLRGNDSKMRNSWKNVVVWRGEYFLVSQLNQDGAILSYMRISEKLAQKLLDIDDEEVYTEKASRIIYA